MTVGLGVREGYFKEGCSWSISLRRWPMSQDLQQTWGVADGGLMVTRISQE